MSDSLVTRDQIKSCCGSASFVFQLKKAIKKSHISLFKAQGYSVPKNFLDIGIFYVQKGNLVATASFGATRISVRCNGNDCGKMMDELQLLFEVALKQ